MKLGFTLYAVMLLSAAVTAFLATDESAKFIAPENLFWARGLTSMVSMVSTGLKAYTSQTFSEWKEAKRNGIKTGDTEFASKLTGP